MDVIAKLVELFADALGRSASVPVGSPELLAAAIEVVEAQAAMDEARPDFTRQQLIRLQQSIVSLAHACMCFEAALALRVPEPSALAAPPVEGGWQAITRLEVIDDTGRVLTRYPKSLEFSVQDEGRTLKVFISGHREDVPEAQAAGLAEALSKMRGAPGVAVPTGKSREE